MDFSSAVPNSIIIPDQPHVPSDQPTQEELLARAGAIDDALAALSAFENRPYRSVHKAGLMGSPFDKARQLRRRRRRRTNQSSSPPDSLPSSLMLDATDIAHLPTAVRTVLAEYRIDPVTTTLPSMLRTLRIELGRIEEECRMSPKRFANARKTYGPYNPLTEPQAN